MEYIYREFKKRQQRLFECYNDFINSSDEWVCETNVLHGVITCNKCAEDSLEFDVAGRLFIMKGSIFVSLGTLYIKTYEVLEDLAVCSRSQMRHVGDLDFVCNAAQTRFVKRIERESGVLQSSEPTLITDFNIQYTMQLWNYILKRESEDMPQLEVI